MADAAEYGLMLWDGNSKGTVNNVVNLFRDDKPVVVYVAPTKQFRTIRTSDDLSDLLAQGDSDSVQRIVSELHLQSHRAARRRSCEKRRNVDVKVLVHSMKDPGGASRALARKLVALRGPPDAGTVTRPPSVGSAQRPELAAATARSNAKK